MKFNTEIVEDADEGKIDVSEGPPSVNPITAEQLERRSVKYHMALGDTSPGVEKISTLLSSPGGDNILRQQAALDERNKRRGAAVEVFKEATVDSETMAAAAEASLKPVNPESVIERRYAEALLGTSLSLTKNPDEVNEGFGELSQDTFDYLVNIQTKQEAYGKMLEDIQAQKKDRSWGMAISDFGAGFIPFRNEALNRPGALNEFTVSFLPGQAREEQYAYLRSLPPDEAISLAKRAVDEISSQSLFAAEEWLTGLVEGYAATDAGLTNFFFGLDAAGLVPAGAVSKLGGYAAKKAALNSVPAAAADITEGSARAAWANGKVANRLTRTKLAASQPGAKVDEILSASGHVEEASRIKALEIARSALPNDGASMQEQLAKVIDKLPSIVSPSKFFDMSTAHKERAADLADLMESNVSTMSQMVRGVTNVAFAPAEVRQLALEVAEKELDSRLNAQGIRRYAMTAIQKYDNRESSLNIGYVEAKFGNKKKLPFKTAEGAETYAANVYKFKKGDYDVTQEGDGYAITVRADVNETSSAVREALITTSNTSNTERAKLWGIAPVIPKAVSGAKESFSEFQNQQRLVLTVAQTATERYAKAMVEPMNALTKRERQDLEKILQLNRTTFRDPKDPNSMGKFYESAADFEMDYLKHNGRLPTEAEEAAYYTMVQQNQMDYIFRTVNTYKAKARLGHGRITTSMNGKDISFEGKELDHLPKMSGHDAGVFVAYGKGKYHRLQEAGFVERISKEIKDKNWKVVQLYDPQDSKFKEAFKVSGNVHFAVLPNAKKSALRLEEQVNYNPGGHVRYNAPYYITQAVVNRDSSGKRIYSGDVAFIAAKNEAEGQKYLGLIDRAREAVKNKDDAALRQVVKDGLPMEFDEAKRLFKKDGRFTTDTPFTLRPQGVSASHSTAKTARGKLLRDEIGDDFVDDVENPFNDSRKLSSEYLGAKNGPLWSVKEGTEENPVASLEDAAMVDVYTTQAEAMNRLIRDKHYNDYQMQAAESWVKEFSDLITLNGSRVSERDLLRNPLFYLEHGLIDKKLGRMDARVATAANNQAAIQNLLRHKSYIGQAMTHFKTALMKGSGLEKYTALDDSLTWMAKDLPSKFRSAAFHTKMGLFSIQQFALQMNTVPLIIARSPKHGLSSVHISAWMGRLNLFGDDPRVLDKMSRAAAKITPGWTAEQFAESFKLLRRTGYDDVLRASAYTDDLKDAKLFKGTAQTILDLGTKPFTAAERWVLLSSWNSAYKEYLDKFPALAGKLTDDDAAFILNRADDLAMSMRRSGMARWQANDLSLMTQFWGYTMRIFDTFTSNRVSAAEKVRMFSMMAALYGVPTAATVAALPIYPWDKVLRENLMEMGVDPNEGWIDPFMNGLLAASISGLTYLRTGEEVQLDISGRWGPSANQALYQLMNTQRGETGLSELAVLLGGASGTIVSQIALDAWPVAKDIAKTLIPGGEGTAVLQASSNRLAKHVSTYSAVERTWQALRTGTYRTKDGRVIDDDYQPWQAIFAGLTGIQSQDVGDSFLQFQSVDDDRAEKAKLNKEAKQFMRLYLETDPGDQASRDEYLARITSVFDSGGYTHPQRLRVWKELINEKPLEETAAEAFVKSPNDPAEEAVRRAMTEE